MARKIFDIENIPVTLISKPYKKFVKIIIKLCVIFSLLVMVSFTPVMILFLSVVYVQFIYINWIFISFCEKFGYKKRMCVLVLAVLYFICYLSAVNLRHFALILFALNTQMFFYFVIVISVLFFVFLLILLFYSWGKVFIEQFKGFLMARYYKNRRRNRK